MKKRQVFGLVVAGLLAGFVSSALAQSATAYSSSAVGVIKKSIPAGCQMLVSIPLDIAEMNNDATIAFTDLPFLKDMPANSTANIWDVENNKWISGTKRPNGKWVGAITNRSVACGESLFLKNGSTTADADLIISGEVPSDATISIALGAANQQQLLANPYPVSFVFTNSALATNPQQSVFGSTVNFWVADPDSPTKGNYVSARVGGGSKWTGTARDYVVSPGEGFFFKKGTSATTNAGPWVVSKPYTWPGEN